MSNIFSKKIIKPEPVVEPVFEQVEESKGENKFDELKVEIKQKPEVEHEPKKIVLNDDKPEPKQNIFINTFNDSSIIELRSINQHYEKVNIVDLVNIKHEYDVILQTVPGKTDSPGNGTSKKTSMFINTSSPKPIKGKNVVFENLNLSIKDIKGRGQFVTLLGKSGCGKCFTKDSIITIRNKKTKKIEIISSEELIKRFQHPD